jgi:hypothetical protein
MKKTVLFLLAVLGASWAGAQTCEPDLTILGTDEVVRPAPYSPDNPTINTAPACIGEDYTQSFTIQVPDTFTYNGFPLPIDSVTMGPNAISGLPAGLTYLCDPSNCHFPKNTLGCILIYGVPAGPTGQYEITIQVSVHTPSLPFPVPLTLPGGVAPDNQYFIVVNPAGQCDVGTNTLPTYISSVVNAPNPFSGETTFTVEALVQGEYQFEVFDLVGRRVHARTIQLTPGTNRFGFDAAHLAGGAYYYSLSNRQGRVARLMVVN